MSKLAVVILAFWPVWSWYWARSMDGSDEPWGILALLTAALFVIKEARGRLVQIPPAALAVLAIYGAAYHLLPALLRAALALVCIGLTISPLLSHRKFHLGFCGLLLLSLPIIASLQFYAGYPLRALTGKLVAVLIGITGEQVVAVGTSLLWRGDVLSIDVPCSGIKMLWSGLYVAFTLACFLNLSNSQTWLGYVFSSLTIFVANIARTFVLFFTESRIVPAPQWFHAFAGIATFCVALLVIFSVLSWMQRRNDEAWRFCEVK
ncbi:MAG: archaeosortase/exosortase family protein [Deltaproteobacteria bacterium]|nr:archaeosortase/exosortase family protein [Deltaproteobacteria bacterium]